MSVLEGRVRRLESETAARTEPLTIVLQHVTPDGTVVDTRYIRYDGIGPKLMCSQHDK
jgi:hypothetical protein